MNNTLISKYFPELTGIRAVAAYMVFIHHFNFIDPEIFGKTAYGMAKELHIGVTFFFVLSGFLISYRYSELKNFSFKYYITNRIARIYPTYFILTTIAFIATNIFRQSDSNNTWLVYFLNITFLRGFFENFKFTLVAQGWSLTVEETFYILAPLMFVILGKLKKIGYVVIPIVSIMVGVVLHLIFRDINFGGFFRSTEFLFNYTFFGRIFEFISGMLLAQIIKAKIILPKGSMIFGIIVTFLVLFGLYLLQENGINDFGIRTISGKVINTLILPIFGILPIYYGLITGETAISRLLASRAFQILGKSSYVFYLIHTGIFHKFISMYLTTNIFVNLLFIQIISILIWYYFEEPANHFIRKRFNFSKIKSSPSGFKLISLKR